MLTLNNKATGEVYKAEVTLEGAPGVQVNFIVSNAAVFYQLKIPTEPGVPTTGWNWSEDIFCPPSFQSLKRVCVGIRFKSANKEFPAQVTAQLLTALDTGG